MALKVRLLSGLRLWATLTVYSQQNLTMDEKNNSSFLAKFSSAPLLTETALIAVFVCFRTVLFGMTCVSRIIVGMPMGCHALIVELPLTLNIVGALMFMSI